MQDKETIQVYNDSLESYIKCADSGTLTPALSGFIEKFEPNNYILDLGCGPGDSAYHMQSAGLAVDAIDASAEMVKHARQKFNVDARVATFNDLTEKDVYEGVWANFSLLHAPQSEFPKHLKAIHSALKHGGYFHLGAKLGKGEKRDKLGRFYSYYTEREFCRHLKQAGFEVETINRGAGKGLAGNIEPSITILARAVK